MGLIILHENHTLVNNLKSDLQMAVSATEDLGTKIKELVYAIDHSVKTAVPGYYNELHIYCSNTDAGLCLGSVINHNNIADIFKPLRFKVGNIIIHSEGAALIYKHANNGVLMCKRLAASVYANVTATASVGHITLNSYRYNSAVKNMTGTTCATWNQAGKIVMLRESSLGLTGRGMNYKLSAKPACPAEHKDSIIKNAIYFYNTIANRFEMRALKYVLALRFVMAITGRG